MKLEVEPTSIAERLPLIVPPPQRGGIGLTVSADHANAPVTSVRDHFQMFSHND